MRVAGVEIKYLVVPEVDPKKVSFSYQLFLDDFVRVCVTSDFRVWTSTINMYFIVDVFELGKNDLLLKG